MLLRLIIAASVLVVAFQRPALADEREEHAQGPCKEIKQACLSAGYIDGAWQKGDGLWRDCINPIMQGITDVPGATKPLPTVDPKVVARCKAKHPKFGVGKVGS